MNAEDTWCSCCAGEVAKVVKRDVVRARLCLGTRLPGGTVPNFIDLASTATPLIISKEKWDGEAKHGYGVIGWLLLSLCRNGQRGDARPGALIFV